MANELPSTTSRRSRCRPRRAGLAALLVLLLACLAAPAGAHWYFHSPGPHPYTLRAVHLFDAGHVLALGDIASIIRSRDGGRTWVPQTSSLGDEVNLASVYFHDADNGHATGAISDWTLPSGVIIRTQDGGASWQLQYTLPASLIYDVAFVDADVGIAVGVDFQTAMTVVLRTTDGGDSWQRVDQAGGFGVVLTALDVHDGPTATAVGADLFSGAAVIMRTDDAGLTWAPVPVTVSGQLNDVTFRDADTGIAVGTGGSVLTTVDGGDSWIQRQAGTGLDLYRAAYNGSGQPVAVGGITGAGRQGVVLVTADGGQTWAAQATGYQLEDVAFDGNEGIAVGVAGEMLLTHDGGASWTSAARRLSVNGLNGLVIDDDGDGLAVGSAGSIFRTFDAGANWTPRSSGTPTDLYDVDMAGDVAIAVGGDVQHDTQVIVTSSDRGETWAPLTPQGIAPLPLLDVSCPAQGECVAVGMCGQIVRTLDAGQTWSVSRDPDCAQNPPIESVSILSSGHGTAVGRMTILTTTDRGATWTVRVSPDTPDPPSNQVLRAVVQTGPDTIVIAGGHQDDGGVILRSDDGGASWSVPLDGVPGNFYALDMRGDTGLATALNGDVFRSIDGGVSWVREQRVVANLYGVQLLAGTSAVAVGYGTGHAVVIASEGGPAFPLHLSPTGASVCRPESGEAVVPVQFTASSAGGYTGDIHLATSGEPAGVTSTLAAPSLGVPGASTWNLAVGSQTPPGRYPIQLVGSDGAASRRAVFQLDVGAAPEAPQLQQPADGETGVPAGSLLTWQAVPGAERYRVQVARDPQLADLIADAETQAPSLPLPDDLESGATLYWRVQALGTCGGTWSDVRRFVTAAPAIIEVVPSALAASLAAGEQRALALYVSNEGEAVLDWQVRAAGASCDDPQSPAWLTVSPASGATAAGAKSALEVGIDARTLAAGAYVGRLCVASNDPAQPLAEVPVQVSVTAAPLPTLALLDGDGQSATVGQPFARPLAVQAIDGSGRPVPGVVVAFSAPTQGAGAGLSATSVTTDAAGYAAVVATANHTPGSFTVTAAGDGVDGSVTFALTNLAPAPDLAVTATALDGFVRAGQIADYFVLVENIGADVATGAAVAAELSSTLDAGGASWLCLGPATSGCEPAGSGPLLDTGLSLPAGGSVAYLVSAPVRSDADGQATLTALVEHPGDVHPGNDVSQAGSIIVLYRDGFESGGGNGGGAEDGMQPLAAEHDVLLAPGPVSGGGIDVVAIGYAHASATSPHVPLFRVERLQSGVHGWLRLVARGHDGAPALATPWLAPGADGTAVLEVRAAADDGETALVLRTQSGTSGIDAPPGIAAFRVLRMHGVDGFHAH